jgi:hypothetical protein
LATPTRKGKERDTTLITYLQIRIKTCILLKVTALFGTLTISSQIKYFRRYSSLELDYHLIFKLPLQAPKNFKYTCEDFSIVFCSQSAHTSNSKSPRHLDIEVLFISDGLGQLYILQIPKSISEQDTIILFQGPITIDHKPIVVIAAKIGPGTIFHSRDPKITENTFECICKFVHEKVNLNKDFNVTGYQKVQYEHLLYILSLSYKDPQQLFIDGIEVLEGAEEPQLVVFGGNFRSISGV